MRVIGFRPVAVELGTATAALQAAYASNTPRDVSRVRAELAAARGDGGGEEGQDEENDAVAEVVSSHSHHAAAVARARAEKADVGAAAAAAAAAAPPPPPPPPPPPGVVSASASATATATAAEQPTTKRRTQHSVQVKAQLVFPSDHYGLVVKLDVLPAGAKAAAQQRQRH